MNKFLFYPILVIKKKKNVSSKFYFYIKFTVLYEILSPILLFNTKTFIHKICAKVMRLNNDYY